MKDMSNPEIDVSSFVLTIPENEPVIALEVGVSQYSPGDNDDYRKIIYRKERLYPAIIDTGATQSCIPHRIVEDLGLPTLSFISVETANGVCEHSAHLINISLPNSVTCIGMPVTCGNIGNEVIIGMDILRRGDLYIVHRHGYRIIHFHMYNILNPPPLQKT